MKYYLNMKIKLYLKQIELIGIIIKMNKLNQNKKKILIYYMMIILISFN